MVYSHCLKSNLIRCYSHITTFSVVNYHGSGLTVRGVESVATSEEKALRIDSGTTLRSVILVMIESRMALFVIQLARVVVTSIQASTDAETEAFEFIASIHQMLNVSSYGHQSLLLITSI